MTLEQCRHEIDQTATPAVSDHAALARLLEVDHRRRHLEAVDDPEEPCPTSSQQSDGATLHKRAHGRKELVGVRFPPELLARLDASRVKMRDHPSRPEAVRRLVDAMLTRLEKYD